MTSASELFNNRRYRFGRNVIEFGTGDTSSGAGDGDGFSFHPHRRRNYHHHSHGPRRRHHDADGFDHPRRVDRRASLERDSVRFDQGGGSSSSQSIPANIDLEVYRSMPIRERYVGVNRLPGDVVLARERLVERLRSIQLTDQSVSSRFIDITLHNNMREIEEWRMLVGLNPATSSNSDMRSFLALEAARQRPPGLTQDALDHLHIEVFTTIENGDEENISRASLECSICLENFLEGAELVRLPCGHKYHQCCLFPWVRSCGDCPYCRAAITVTSI